MTAWVEGRRMVPGVGASPAEVDRALGHPRVYAQREGKASCLVSWSFVHGPPPAYPPQWEWAVERSGSPGGPFTQVSPWRAHTEPSWRDDDLPLGRENSRQPYYRILFRWEGEVLRFGYRPEWDTVVPGGDLHGFTWGEDGVRSAYCPPVVRETRRRFTLMSRSHTREVAALYRPAWLEGACDICVNPMTGEKQAPPGGGPCPSCFGTGYTGGFYSPLRFDVMPMASSGISPQPIPQGAHDLVEQDRVVTQWWPIPQAYDIIRKRDGSLFLVQTVTPLEAYGYPVAHIVDVTQVERTHPLSAIPIPRALLDASAGPRRQHGRALNLEAYRSSLEDGAMAWAGATVPDGPPSDADPDR